MKMRMLVGIIAIFVAMALFGVLIVLRTEHAAKSFLSRYRVLVPGQTSLSDARRTLGGYRQYQVNATSCTSSDCELEFRFRNSLLSFLHLAPSTGLDSFLQFHDGILVNRLTYFAQGWCCVVYVREDLPAEGMPASQAAAPQNRFFRRLERDGSGRPWHTTVVLTSQASQQERDLAYSFNLRCLYKIGGCKTAEELSPDIWKKGD